MKLTPCAAMTLREGRYIIALMPKPSKDTRSDAEKARDTASIVGSMRHEGYVPTPETEAIHQRAERGEISTDELVETFRQRALNLESKKRARKPSKSA